MDFYYIFICFQKTEYANRSDNRAKGEINMLKLKLNFFGEGDDLPPAEELKQDSKPETKEPVTITQDALNAMDAKAKTKGEQSIIKQLGLASKDDIPKLLERLAAIKEAEEKAELEKPELERLSTGMTAAEKRAAEAEARADKLEAEFIVNKRENFLKEHGFKGRDLKGALVEISEAIENDDDWQEAAEKYVRDNPLAPPPPIMAEGTGNKPLDKEKKVPYEPKKIF